MAVPVYFLRKLASRTEEGRGQNAGGLSVSLSWSNGREPGPLLRLRHVNTSETTTIVKRPSKFQWWLTGQIIREFYAAADARLLSRQTRKIHRRRDRRRAGESHQQPGAADRQNERPEIGDGNARTGPCKDHKDITGKFCACLTPMAPNHCCSHTYG
jgi:hypothetical protein